jgi:hypothetical protein
MDRTEYSECVASVLGIDRSDSIIIVYVIVVMRLIVAFQPVCPENQEFRPEVLQQV